MSDSESRTYEIQHEGFAPNSWFTYNLDVATTVELAMKKLKSKKYCLLNEYIKIARNLKKNKGYNVRILEVHKEIVWKEGD